MGIGDNCRSQKGEILSFTEQRFSFLLKSKSLICGILNRRYFTSCWTVLILYIGFTQKVIREDQRFRRKEGSI